MSALQAPGLPWLFEKQLSSDLILSQDIPLRRSFGIAAWKHTHTQVPRLTDRREHQPSPGDAAPPTRSHLLVAAVCVLEGPLNTEDVEEIVSYSFWYVNLTISVLKSSLSFSFLRDEMRVIKHLCHRPYGGENPVTSHRETPRCCVMSVLFWYRHLGQQTVLAQVGCSSENTAEHNCFHKLLIACFIHFFGMSSKCPTQASGFWRAKVGHEKTAQRWNFPLRWEVGKGHLRPTGFSVVLQYGRWRACFLNQTRERKVRIWTDQLAPCRRGVWRVAAQMDWLAGAQAAFSSGGVCTSSPRPASVNPQHSKLCSSSLPFPSGILQFLLQLSLKFNCPQKRINMLRAWKDWIKNIHDYVDKFLFPERLIQARSRRLSNKKVWSILSDGLIGRRS